MCGDEGKKTSVKRVEIVIYWERVAPYAALIITHLSVVGSRQRSYDRLRCEKENRLEETVDGFKCSKTDSS